MARVLITGVAGQDGVLLAEQLLARGDTVIGTTRGDPLDVRTRLSAATEKVHLRELDLRDARAVDALIEEVRPDQLFHLAAPAVPNLAWKSPAEATDALCTVPARLLESVLRHTPATRFVFAGSCQVFGPDSIAPQSERTPHSPLSPYGAGKAFAAMLVASFREGRGMHASTALLFNHESARRQADYVTTKICRAAVRIAAGDRTATPLTLGALDVVRDWGHASDHMRALMLMADADTAGDYVIGTGIGRTVGEFCAAAFARVGLDWKAHVVHDPALSRAGDVPALVADPRRAEERLGWKATTTFEALLDEMLDAARTTLAVPSGTPN
ncbi:MAG TPA: GDP-mannose 4,6-dehydratase [Gemmatimonadaceae bacterium]|nr:GDP-mannose 4,6-dehydratase [Gemmatimonadaceae bacterium]